MAWKNYRELIAWQKAMDAAEEIYKVVKKLPKMELFAMSDQMRRAAVSVPSNIAEGQARSSKKEFAWFLSVAQGSRAELETQLMLAVKIGYLPATDIEKALGLLEEISKLLTVLMHSQRPSLK